MERLDRVQVEPGLFPVAVQSPDADEKRGRDVESGDVQLGDRLGESYAELNKSLAVPADRGAGVGAVESDFVNSDVRPWAVVDAPKEPKNDVGALPEGDRPAVRRSERLPRVRVRGVLSGKRSGKVLLNPGGVSVPKLGGSAVNQAETASEEGAGDRSAN